MKTAAKRVPGAKRKKRHVAAVVSTWPYGLCQAARMLRMHEKRLKGLLASGEIKGRVDEGDGRKRWLILGSELLRWIAEGAAKR